MKKLWLEDYEGNRILYRGHTKTKNGICFYGSCNHWELWASEERIKEIIGKIDDCLFRVNVSTESDVLLKLGSIVWSEFRECKLYLREISH